MSETVDVKRYRDGDEDEPNDKRAKAQVACPDCEQTFDHRVQLSRHKDSCESRAVGGIALTSVHHSCRSCVAGTLQELNALYEQKGSHDLAPADADVSGALEFDVAHDPQLAAALAAVASLETDDAAGVPAEDFGEPPDLSQPPPDADLPAVDRSVLRESMQAAYRDMGRLQKDAQPDSTYPFASLTEYKLYVWKAAGSVSEEQMQTLLELLREPDFRAADVPRRVARFAEIDNLILKDQIGACTIFDVLVSLSSVCVELQKMSRSPLACRACVPPLPSRRERTCRPLRSSRSSA